MSWIKSVPYGEASGRLRALYDRIKGPGDYLDKIIQVHGLRPHSLEGHMALYKSVLHHTGNRLPVWWLETLGVYVSLLNSCSYCVEHHFAGLGRLLEDPERAAAIRRALEAAYFDEVFDEREIAMLRYAEQLTLDPGALSRAAIEAMLEAGLDAGEILEVNQVASYFAYANRTVLGLGVTSAGDRLGLSPPDTDAALDWHHG